MSADEAAGAGAGAEHAEHYFTARPASDGELREQDVVLAGRDVRVLTAAGIFSPAGVDKGTAVLLREAPEPPASGTFLDLGCGWGPLALTLALHSPAAQVKAIDVNTRALDLARRNANRLGCTNVRTCSPDDLPPDLGYDLIWSNPPIRVGKQALHAMLATWLPRLTPTGTAYLVVQKNLGSDSLQRWLGEAGWVCRRQATSKGFRVLEVSR